MSLYYILSDITLHRCNCCINNNINISIRHKNNNCYYNININPYAYINYRQYHQSLCNYY